MENNDNYGMMEDVNRHFIEQMIPQQKRGCKTVQMLLRNSDNRKMLALPESIIKLKMMK